MNATANPPDKAAPPMPESFWKLAFALLIVVPIIVYSFKKAVEEILTPSPGPHTRSRIVGTPPARHVDPLWDDWLDRPDG